MRRRPSPERYTTQPTRPGDQSRPTQDTTQVCNEYSETVRETQRHQTKSTDDQGYPSPQRPDQYHVTREITVERTDYPDEYPTHGFPSQPAAGKPSYAGPRKPTDDQPERPAGKPSYTNQKPTSQQPAGKPSYTTQPHPPVKSQPTAGKPSSQPQMRPQNEREIPIDTSEYPRDSRPQDYTTHGYPTASQPQQPAGKPSVTPQRPGYEREIPIDSSQYPRTKQSSPQPQHPAGKPSYTPHAPAGKPSYPSQKQSRPEYDEPETQSYPQHPAGKPSSQPRRPGDYPNQGPRPQEPGYVHEITVETSEYTTDRRQPAGKPSYTPQAPVGKTTYPTQKPSGPEYGGRDSPSGRPRESYPSHPAGKPSSQPRQPNEYPNQIPRHQEPGHLHEVTVETTEYTTERRPAAGKPSYTTPRKPYDDTPTGRPEYENGYSTPKTQQPYGRPKPEGSYPDSAGDRTPQYSRQTSTESSQQRNEYNTTKRISVDVNAAHETFARSLRCVSPVDRGSVKSLRTSTSSIRSSASPDKRISPDKRTRRSPSRDSMTFSESSRISSSTITRGKTNTSRDIRKTQPKAPTSPTKPKTKTSDLHRSNETVDLTKTKIDEDTRRKGTKHTTTTVTRKINEYPASRSPYSSPERSTRPGQHSPERPRDQSPTKDSIYDVPKTPRKVKTESPYSSPERPHQPKNTTTTKFTKTVKVDNAILRDKTTKKPTKKPTGKKPSSDDEGFEPESPRSSSPTSSVSDLVYQKHPEDHPRQTTEIEDLTIDRVTKRKDTENREFINREREYIDSDVIRRKPERESPDRYSPSRTSPRRDSPDRVTRTNREEIYDETVVDRRTTQRRTQEDEDKTVINRTTTVGKTRPDDTQPRKPGDQPNRTYPREDSPNRLIRTTEESTTTTTVKATRPGDKGPHKEEPQRLRPRQDSPERPVRRIDETTIDRSKTVRKTEPYDQSPRKRSPDDEPERSSPRRDSPERPHRVNREDTYDETTVRKTTVKKTEPDDRSPKRGSPYHEEPSRASPRRESPDRIVRTNKEHIYDESTFEQKTILNKTRPDDRSPKRASPDRPVTRKESPTRSIRTDRENTYDETTTTRKTTKKDFPDDEETRTRSPNRKPSPDRLVRTTVETTVEEKYGKTEPRKYSPGPRDTPEYGRPRPRQESPNRRRPNGESPERTVQFSTDDSSDNREPREPFYLIEPNEESPKKPEDIKKPKARPPLNRTETYEERCRQILGMDRTDRTDTITTETTDRRGRKPLSPQRDTNDFITTERTTEERTQLRKQSQPTPSPRSTSPRKPTRPDDEDIMISSTEKRRREEVTRETLKTRSPSLSPSRRSKAPTRETSPIKRGDISPERDTPSDTVCYITTSRKEIYSPEDSPRHGSPTRKPATKAAPTSPTRKPTTPASVSPTRRGHINTTETVTVTTRRTAKDSPTDHSPVRPNHITTAKINLSPTPARKISTPDVKKSPKSPQTKPTLRDTTPRVSKPTSGPKPTTKQTTDRYTTDKRTEIRRRIDHKTTEEDDDESDIPSDNEDVTTTTQTKTTTRVTGNTQPSKKLPITERKESAPVYRTTRTDKDKMTRSTSDNIIKTTTTRHTTKPNIETTLVEPKSPKKPTTDKSPVKNQRHPTKCMTTKTINLTTNSLINSEDMENVIIDIQQAKSSREPSPNRMVPTPVHYDQYTGKPRYPDTVQEPEEEPRRRPKVKDIPIFEEETNDYVRCHITEVDERTATRHITEDDETITRRTTRGPSPRKTHPSEPDDDDEYSLSVQDKVTKFISTAEEVKKPKTSAPFRRDVKPEHLPESDDCLLSVTDKVNKFTATVESVTKPMKPNKRPTDDDDNPTDKLNSTIPQKSPQLVAKVERQISRPRDEPSDESEREIITKTTTKSSVTDRYTPQKPKQVEKSSSSKPIVLRSTEAVRKAKSVFENGDTKPKQRDILSRPSVWEGKKTEIDVKLLDIGVRKVFDEETEEIFRRERSRSQSPEKYDDASQPRTITTTPKVKSTPLTDSVSSKKNMFESRSTTSSTTRTSTAVKQTSQDSITRDRTTPKTPTKRQDVTTTVTSKTVKSKPLDNSSPRRPGESSPSKHPEEYISKKRPQDTSPAKRPQDKIPRAYSPSGRESTYIEESTEKVTTTRRSSRTSPTRPTDSYIPIKGTRSRPDDYSPSRTVDSRYVERTQTSQTSGTRYPDESTPGKRLPQTTGPKAVPKDNYTTKTSPKRPTDLREPSPSTRHGKTYLQETVSTKHDGYDSPTSLTDVPSYMETTVSSREHFRRDSSDINRRHARGTSHDSLYSNEQRHRFDGEDIYTPEPGDDSLPSYMEHTVSSREHFRRDSLDISKTHIRRTSHDSLYSSEPREGTPRSGTKFGVELKRTDSRDGKVRRKSSTSDVPHIEEIFDLELLERMLETVVGYEHRRRIRSQIRIVRKMIEEETQKKSVTTRTVITKKVSGTSPTRKPESYISQRTELVPERRASPIRKTYLADDSRTSSSKLIESESRHVTKREEKVIRERSISPQGKVRTVTTTTTEIRKSGEKPVVKKSTVVTESKDNKPIWATKNILKKATDNDRTSGSSVKRTTTTKSQKQRVISSRDDADCITSSYGIGPTDEDGKPLFGIRALKKKTTQPGETTKVTGTIVSEKYYSENGAQPVGERKVTMYSTNPSDVDNFEDKISRRQKNDLVSRERSSKDGVTSVTRVQKIGNLRDAEVADELPAITDGKTSTTTTKQSKIVRKGSVKEISEKFIRKESSSSITEKTGGTSYPKAGLILRSQKSLTSGDKDSNDSTDECDIEVHTTRRKSRSQIVTESDNETESTIVSKSSKSFLNSAGSKVTGVNDVLDRMRNADNVIEDGDTVEDQEARSLLNKFLGASVLMSGMESMMPKHVVTKTSVESPIEVKTTRVTKTVKTGRSSSPVARKTCDIEEIWDEDYLKKLLEQSTNYEERRRIRARLRQLMAEREELCTTKTTERKETKDEGNGAVVTTTTKVTTRTVAAAPKPMSPFAKFRQLDKQNSQSSNSPLTPTSPMTPGGTNRAAPLFQFTDPALNARAATFKEQLLQWCQMKTKEYENVQITNFSGSWTDGLAFCALIHHFLPDAFDYSKLTPQQRRYNFELAFRVADEKAGIAPLLDVEDMVVMKRPDWKCVFTYVQTIFRRFRNCT